MIFFLERLWTKNMKKSKPYQHRTPNVLYGEKKKAVTMTLTETAVKLLDQMATELTLNRSELIEQIARGIISSQGGVITSEQAGKS